MQDPQFFHKLQKGRQARGITARVIRKWTIYDTSGNNRPLYAGMVLADAKGDAMYCQIPKTLVQDKGSLFDVGKVYLIKKFVVEDSRNTYKPVDKNVMIVITDYTSAELVRNPPTTIPEYIYNITPLSSIKISHNVSKYTDVIGYLVKYNALHTFVQRNTENTKTLREIYIKDLRENIMKVTLWDKEAADFSIDNIYDPAAGNIIVCLIVGCIPRQEFRERDKIFLSGSPACAYYFNPPIPEAAPFYSRFENTPVYVDEPPAALKNPKEIPQQVFLPQKTISQLEAIDPFDDKEPGPYKCTVTITAIANTTTWWYMSCKPCKKKAEQQRDRTYKCPKCLGSDTIPRYTLTMIGKDDTAEAQFFAFDDEAHKLIQRDCESVLGMLTKDGDLPIPVRNIIGKTFVLSVDLTNDSCKFSKKREYQVKAVLQRPEKSSGIENALAIQTPPQLSVSTPPGFAQQRPPPSIVETPEQEHERLPPAIQTLENVSKDAAHSAEPSSKHNTVKPSTISESARKNLQPELDAAAEIEIADPDMDKSVDPAIKRLKKNDGSQGGPRSAPQ